MLCEEVAEQVVAAKPLAERSAADSALMLSGLCMVADLESHLLMHTSEFAWHLCGLEFLHRGQRSAQSFVAGRYISHRWRMAALLG